MQEASQDADYFVQLNELFVNFKLIMKKFKPPESVDNTDNEEDDSEKENVDRRDYVETAKSLTAAILGCLDAKMDGLTPDLHYYRLIGMKSSILVERSKIFAAVDEDEESFKILEEALVAIMDAVPRPETSYVALRLVNHFAYVLSVEEQFERAKTVLLEGERLYSLIGEDAAHAGFLSSDDLFMPECVAPAPRSETSGYLERLATNNMQMLGFVHGRLGDWVRFASCGHVALRRQLEGREGEALAWATRAARLAQNFLTRSMYREARTHLAAATSVFETYEADLKAVEPDDQAQQKMAEVALRGGDIGRAWTKYALHLLDASAKDDDDDDDDDDDSTTSSSSAGSASSSELGEVGESGEPGEPGGGDGDGDKLAAEEQKKKRHRKGSIERASKEDRQEQGDVVTDDAEQQLDGDQGVAVDEEGDHRHPGATPNADQPRGGVQGVGVDEEGDHRPPGATPNTDQHRGGALEVDDADAGKKAAEDGAVVVQITESTTPDEEDAAPEVTEPEVTEPEVVEVVVPDVVEASHYDDCCGLHVVDDDQEDAVDQEDAADQEDAVDEEDADDSEDYTFPTLDVDYIYDVVACELITSPDKARALTHYAMSWSERVLKTYDVTSHPEQHLTAAMDHAELLRYHANHAPLDAAYQLHRRRANLIEQVCEAVQAASPETFALTSGDIYRELADIQLEMMTLNLRRLDVASVEPSGCDQL